MSPLSYLKRHGARPHSESTFNALTLESGPSPTDNASTTNQVWLKKGQGLENGHQPSERISSALALEGLVGKVPAKGTGQSLWNEWQKTLQMTTQVPIDLNAISTSTAGAADEGIASSILFDALGLDATCHLKLQKKWQVQQHKQQQLLEQKLVSMVAPKHLPTPKFIKVLEATEKPDQDIDKDILENNMEYCCDKDCSSSSTGAPSQDSSSEVDEFIVV